MIYVDRRIIKAPAVLSSPKAKKTFLDARAFYDRPLSSRLQERPVFSSDVWIDTKPVLKELFNEKCAFCETKLVGSKVSEVDQFRPKGGSLNLDGHFAPDHYWWLVYEWFNLYLVCSQCNRNKASRFPVEGHRVKVPKGPHAKLGASWYQRELKIEKPLLLDPCERGFDPDAHLVFDFETGRVAGLTKRGKVTIEIFDLNRSELIEGRKRVLMHVFDLVDGLITGRSGPLWATTQLRVAQMDSSEYAAAQRQVISRLFVERQVEKYTGLKASQILRRKRRTLAPGEKSARAVHTKQVRKIIGSSTAQTLAREKRKARRAGLNPQYITRIEIHNFRVIEDLVLDFPPSQTREKSWMVLLGENGVGKSSVLKAVTLALQDKAYFAAAKLDAKKILRVGSSSGYVKVYMTGYTEPFHLYFNKKGFQKRNDNQLQTYFFGYGGTRLLPQDHHKPARTKGLVRAENLFDPFLPLINAKSWMLSLGQRPFGYSALALKDLLVRENKDRLFRRQGEIKLRLADFGTSVPLEELSDGYQSMVALTADILKIMLETWPSAEKSQGIVLLDEIDVHLHPRWKIEIVSRLRRTFPRVQFIVTTHDPLCLMGTHPGEVHVLHRNAETERVTATQFDVPPGTTADRVLTGFWFGLPSTVDRETSRMLQEYYKLQRARRTHAIQTRLHHMQQELSSRLGTFADTSIDRVAQSVAAEVIKDRRYRSWPLQRRGEARSEIKEKVVKKVSGRG